VRIVVDVTPLSVPPTGIGTYILETVSACARSGRGHEIVALSLAGRKETAALTRHLQLPAAATRRHRTVRGASIVRAALNRLPAATLERLAGACDAFVGSEWLYPRQHRGLRVAIVYDLVPLRFPQWTTRATRRLHLAKLADVCRADVVVCISHATAGDVETLLAVDRDRIRIAQPGVDSRFREAVPAPPAAVGSRPYVASVCTLEPRKNLGGLLDAYALLRARHPELALVLVGGAGWGDDGVTRRVESLGLAGDVVLTGYLPRDAVPGVVSGARAFCWPALFEGFGIPIVEAQAAGVPVVCSDEPSMDEAAGDASLRVPAGEPAAIADALERAVVDDGLRVELGERGRRHAAGFTWERTAASLLDAIETAAVRR
jgi:glycosyltransferase involved in cell wall biosynthesis